MLLTQNWMFVHIPRTAGTWTHSVLRGACKIDRLSCCQWEGHRHRREELFSGPILSTRRNPYDWYAGMYSLAHPKDMGFSEWLRYETRSDNYSQILHSKRADLPDGVGYAAATWHTMLGAIPIQGQWDTQLRDILDGIHLLRFEHIREDLAAWMHENGFSRSACELAMFDKPINAKGSRRGRPWKEYYGPGDLKYVRTMEAALFEAWPEYAT